MGRGRVFGAVFMALGCTLFGLGLWRGDSLSGFLYLSAGVAFFGLGASYAFSWPGLLGKTRQGRLVASSYLFFWPYHILNYGSVLAFRLLGVTPWQEIVPGLFLGSRLFPWDGKAMQALGIQSVLDLTSEFCEARFFRELPAYCCIPLLDGTAPTPEALEAGIRFVRERLAAGPVYVHCAMGHGRAATFVVGYLLATGQAKDVPSAIEWVKGKRPGVRLRAEQLRAVQGLLERSRPNSH